MNPNIPQPNRQVPPPPAPPTPPPPDQPAPLQSQRQQAKQELKQAIAGSNEPLATARTVFPFTFFPDTITLDREKLTISKRLFLKASEVTTIRIEDIMNVTASVSPLLGSLKIATRYLNTDKTYNITNLHRKDALRLKWIIQGYIISIQKGIDTSSLGTKELVSHLVQLGQDTEM